MSDPVIAYIALGSNLGNRAAHLRAGVAALAGSQNVDLIAVSSAYANAAQTRSGLEDHPDFLNAVASISTTLDAWALLERLHEIEVSEGRNPENRGSWAPRTLDLDLILFGDEQIDSPGLTVPHPRLAERRFVLQPLAELAPLGFVPSPFEATVSDLLASCEDTSELRQIGTDLSPAAGGGQASLWPSDSHAGLASTTLELPPDLNYIAIEGVIGAGKTTLARLFAERFQAKTVLEEFEENPFLARFYEDRPRWAFQTQLAFLASRFRQQQQLADRDLFQEVVVSDYTFDKDRIFARINLAGDELSLYDTMFGIMQMSVPVPDLVVYLQSTTERLMEQIRARGRSYEEGMDPDYIATLNETYNAYFFHYDKTPLLIVNGARLDFVRSADDLEELIGQIAREHYPGTTYYSPAG